MNKVPYIKLTLDQDIPLYLKATNVLSIVKDGVMTSITINHAEYRVKESPEDIIHLIQKSINEKGLID